MPSGNIRELIELILASTGTAPVSKRDTSRAAQDDLGYEAVDSNPAPMQTQADSPDAVEIGRLIADISALTRSTSAPAIGETERVGKQSGGGPGSIVEGIGKTLLSGFGIASLFSGLFGGGTKTEETALPKFEMPDSIDAELALDSRSGEFAPVMYSGFGTPRAAVPPTQVTVNVNAIDSRSFMDHSAEIARAVKEAVLNSHSLNDVIADL